DQAEETEHGKGEARRRERVTPASYDCWKRESTGSPDAGQSRTSRPPEPHELPVVPAGQEPLRRDGADEGEAHIPLRVPHVALCAEEGVRLGAHEECGPPLQQFVKRADGK